MSAPKVLSLLAILLVAGLFAAGCPKPQEPSGPATAPEGKAATLGQPGSTPVATGEPTVYFNPKDRQEVSDKPGKSKTGEDLVAGFYTCPNHLGQRFDKPGKCPIDNLELVLVTPVEDQKMVEEKVQGRTESAGKAAGQPAGGKGQ
jgi:hypothetical protein